MIPYCGDISLLVEEIMNSYIIVHDTDITYSLKSLISCIVTVDW